MKPRWIRYGILVLTFALLCGAGRELWDLPDASFLGLSRRSSQISYVAKGGPAERAGLIPGDLIRTPSPASLDRAGLDPTRVFVQRNGHRLWAEVVPSPLGQRDQAGALALAALTALLLLLGVTTFMHHPTRERGAIAAVSLLCFVLLTPHCRDAAAGGIQLLFGFLEWEQASAIVATAGLLTAGSLLGWRNPARFSNQEQSLVREPSSLREQRARSHGGQRLFLYSTFALGLVVVFLGGLVASRQWGYDSGTSPARFGIVLALTFSGLILSPLFERWVRALPGEPEEADDSYDQTVDSKHTEAAFANES